MTNALYRLHMLNTTTQPVPTNWCCVCACSTWRAVPVRICTSHMMWLSSWTFARSTRCTCAANACTFPLSCSSHGMSTLKCYGMPPVDVGQQRRDHANYGAIASSPTLITCQWQLPRTVEQHNAYYRSMRTMSILFAHKATKLWIQARTPQVKSRV